MTVVAALLHPDWTLDRVMRLNRLAADDAARWDRLRRGIQARSDTRPAPQPERIKRTDIGRAAGPMPKAVCTYCGELRAVRVDGTHIAHGAWAGRCHGSYQPAVTA